MCSDRLPSRGARSPLLLHEPVRKKKKTLIAFGRRLAEPSLSKQANAAKRVVFALVLVNILEQFSVPRKDSHGRPREGSTPSSHLRKKKEAKRLRKMLIWLRFLSQVPKGVFLGLKK